MRQVFSGSVVVLFLAPFALLGGAGPTKNGAPDNNGDWPQWRGPQRNAISTETGLLQQWPGERPQAPVGLAQSQRRQIGRRRLF